MIPLLAEATSPSLPDRATVLVPVGSLEQHGPHLPLDTDTVIACAVVRKAAKALADSGVMALVAPPLNYGSSGEHQDFPGTSSIGGEALQAVVIELVRSMRTWAHHVVFINAHGGNAPSLQRAVQQLRTEGHDVSWAACATETHDLHAGRTETSLMLHLAPWNVRLQHAEPGNTGTIEELLPLLVTDGVKSVSPNGVLGDPAGANSQEGSEILDAIVRDVVTAIVGVAVP